MVDLQNTNTIINLAWLSFYTPKKITKKLFKVINIPTVIKTIKENTFRLPVVSKLMTGVVNMYYYKCKIIYDEFVTLSALPQPKKAKLVKTHPINKITLSEVKDKIPMQQSEVIIENKENDLSNAMIDVPSFVMEPSVDMSYSIEIGENFNEIDSKVISHSIEQLRDDTLVKRRKVIIDDDLNAKEKRQRIKIIKKNEIELPLVSKLFNEYLTNRIVKEVNESSIEIERANSVIEPVFYDFDNFQEEVAIEDSLFSITNLPNEFVFNDIVDCFNKKERAKSFMKLIELANKGKVLLNQQEIYKDIHCILVN